MMRSVSVHRGCESMMRSVSVHRGCEGKHFLATCAGEADTSELKHVIISDELYKRQKYHIS